MSFVVSAGQVNRVATQPNSWGFAVGSLPASLQMSANTWLTYEQLWRTQPALRTVIGFLARNIAQLPLNVYRKLDQDDRERANDHPLSRLLERPFPGTKWTRYRLINWTIHEMAIFDCAFWIKGLVDGERTLMPIPRRFIEPWGSNPMTPTKYRLTGSKGYRDLEPDQVVHFHGYNPVDPRNGVSPIETLRQILAEEWAASTYREQMWRNGARVGGYISRPADAPRWSEPAKERFKAGWQAQYTGDGPEAGGTPVLEDGMTYTPSGITPKDAQYVEARQLTWQEVAVAYYVNPVMLGLMDGSSSGSVPTLHRMLYQDTLGPWLPLLSQDIENQLLLDIDPSAADGKVYVEFNLSEKLRGSFEEQAAAISSSVGGPWMTRDEARSLFNLPHVPGGSELIVPLNVLEGGLASPRDTAPNNPSNEESNGLPPGPKAVNRIEGPPS